MADIAYFEVSTMVRALLRENGHISCILSCAGGFRMWLAVRTGSVEN